MLLYHVTGWERLANIGVGETFTLHPGTQGAEGKGVYFSESAPRISAAEGCRGNPTAIVEIEAPRASARWWRTKPGIARKFGRPITWHSAGRSVHLRVQARADKILRCQIEIEMS